MAQMYFFTPDGDHGEAEGGCIIDTSKWTEEEWDLVTYSPDDHRCKIAALIEKANGRLVFQMSSAGGSSG
jgi:hypothetical protein